jgi:hypothetical protein
MLALVDPETLISANHRLRIIKHLADAARVELSPLFDEMYAADGQGQASIPPEHLLKGSLPISLYSVRTERTCCECLLVTGCSVGFSIMHHGLPNLVRVLYAARVGHEPARGQLVRDAHN